MNSAFIMMLPNLITVARLLAVPLTVWLIITGQTQIAFWVFIAAGVSDAIDGFIAKRFHAETVIGAYLDPIADKALLVSVFLTLGHQEHLPSWFVILVVFRDLLIVGGAVLFETLTHSLEMDPLKISKINTFAQIVLAATVLFSLSHDFPGEAFIKGLLYVVAVTTFASGAAYIFKWGRLAISMEGEDR